MRGLALTWVTILGYCKHNFYSSHKLHFTEDMCTKMDRTRNLALIAPKLVPPNWATHSQYLDYHLYWIFNGQAPQTQYIQNQAPDSPPKPTPLTDTILLLSANNNFIIPVVPGKTLDSSTNLYIILHLSFAPTVKPVGSNFKISRFRQLLSAFTATALVQTTISSCLNY